MVAKIGRNDPCPCGSGKKYKLCCLTKRQAQASGERRLEQAAGQLYSRIVQMVQASPAVDFNSAFQLYWDGKFSPDDAEGIEKQDKLRFLTWYAFDYRPANRIRLIDVLGGRSLTDEQRELWEAWRQEPISLYRAEERLPGGRATLRDLLREEGRPLEGVPVGEDVNQGDVLAGRILPVGPRRVLLSAPLVFPAEAEEELVGTLRDRYENHRQVHPDASWSQFLREDSHVFVHLALKRSGWRPSPKLHLPQESRPRAKVGASGLITLAEDEPGAPRARVSPSGLILPGRFDGS